MLALCAACTNAPQSGREELTVWQSLGKWSGTGLLQTDPFLSNTGLLRVSWEARNSSSAGGGSLRIVLHSDVSGRSLTQVVEQRGPGGGVKYVTEDPRSFFLVIDAKELQWSIEVAEGLSATRRVR